MSRAPYFQVGSAGQLANLYHLSPFLYKNYCARIAVAVVSKNILPACSNQGLGCIHPSNPKPCTTYLLITQWLQNVSKIHNMYRERRRESLHEFFLVRCKGILLTNTACSSLRGTELLVILSVGKQSITDHRANITKIGCVQKHNLRSFSKEAERVTRVHHVLPWLVVLTTVTLQESEPTSYLQGTSGTATEHIQQRLPLWTSLPSQITELCIRWLSGLTKWPVSLGFCVKYATCTSRSDWFGSMGDAPDNQDSNVLP